MVASRSSRVGRDIAGHDYERTSGLDRNGVKRRYLPSIRARAIITDDAHTLG